MISSLLFFLEGNMDGLGTLIFLLFFAAFGVPIVLAIIAAIFFANGKKKTGKVMLIIAGIYLLIGGGLCLSMMGGF